MNQRKEKLRLTLLLILYVSCQSLSFLHTSHYSCPQNNPFSFSQLHELSALKHMHPTEKTCRTTQFQSNRFRSNLFSTLFDDDELDWDAEEDDDEFDVQINSMHDEAQPSLAKDNEKNGGSDGSMADLDGLDDTDESYYEKLFLLQNLSQSGNKDSIVNNDDDDDEIEMEQGQEERAENLSGEKSPKKYEQTKALRKEWKEKVHQMRNESIQTRKFKRQRQRRSKLEERASLLALRALRLQSPSYHENEMDDVEKKLKPVPSLSISSMRNYKRKGDELDKSEIKRQKKLHGKRFKTAQGVYVRLFEVLEEMRMESNKMASEMIADQVEEEVCVSGAVSAGVSGETMTESYSSSRGVASRFVDDVTKMNEIRLARMKRVVQLSLNGGERDSELCLDDLDTEDLRTVIRIRGNARRRGRMPKTRLKVLEYLEESFARPLF